MNVKSLGTSLALVAAGLASSTVLFWYFAGNGDSMRDQAIFPISTQPQSAAVGEGRYAVPFASNRPETDFSAVTGQWVGSVDLGGGNTVQLSFNLKATGNQLTGTATFPIGDGTIQDAKVEGNHLSFNTRHQVDRTGQMLIARFSGNVGDGVIDLDMQSEAGDSKLTINRVSP
jgi:hypothetical protein